MKRRNIVKKKCVRCKGSSICNHLKRREQASRCFKKLKNNEKYYNNCITCENFNNIKLCIHNNNEKDCNACKNEYNLVKYK